MKDSKMIEPTESYEWSTLHLYGQPMPHCEAYLIGDETSLFRLRYAITRAIEKGTSKDEFFCNDGEGYSIYIKKLPPSQMKNVMLPYKHDFEIKDAEGIKPFQFFMEDF